MMDVVLAFTARRGTVATGQGHTETVRTVVAPDTGPAPVCYPEVCVPRLSLFMLNLVWSAGESNPEPQDLEPSAGTVARPLLLSWKPPCQDGGFLLSATVLGISRMYKR
jgi:hypothetical protein